MDLEEVEEGFQPRTQCIQAPVLPLHPPTQEVRNELTPGLRPWDGSQHIRAETTAGKQASFQAGSECRPVNGSGFGQEP